jgi:FG-GAP repeat
MSNAWKRLCVFSAGLLVIGLSASADALAQSPPAQSSGATQPATPAWKPKASVYLKASNAHPDHQYGASIAVSGDGRTVAVGAPLDDSGATGVNGNALDHSARDSGAVFIYTRKGNTWVQQAYVKASNTGAGDQFGNAVALSGDGNTLAVGAYLEDSAATGINGNEGDNSMKNSGAVYVFTRKGGAWSQQAYVKASNTGEKDEGDQFGYVVALSGDGNTLAAGAIGEDSAAKGINGDQTNNSADASGAVYVFTRRGSAWSQQAYVKSSNTVRGMLFGYSVGLSRTGNDLAVGAYDEDRGRGGVYVFTRNGAAWSQEAHLKASNAERGDSLGCTIAISSDGNTVLAGAFDEDSLLTGIQPPNAGASDEKNDTSAGAAYVFVRRAGAWTQQAYMKASNTRPNDQFAWALALSGDGNTVAVGSHLEDGGATGINGNQADLSAEDSGAVYVFTRRGDTWAQQAYVKASNTRAYAEFGISLGLSHDGKTLGVGAFKEDSAATGTSGNQADHSAANAGAAYIYY